MNFDLNGRPTDTFFSVCNSHSVPNYVSEILVFETCPNGKSFFRDLDSDYMYRGKL